MFLSSHTERSGEKSLLLLLDTEQIFGQMLIMEVILKRLYFKAFYLRATFSVAAQEVANRHEVSVVHQSKPSNQLFLVVVVSP